MCLLLACGTPAAAQDAAASRPARALEVAVGGGWVSGSVSSSADAELRTNGGQPLRIFTTEREVGAGVTFETTVAYALTQRLTVEGALALAHPELRTRVSGDVEGAPDVEAVERIDQYLVEGRLLVHLDELRVGGGPIPFVSTGVAYVRRLHEGGALLETGRAYHVGAGVKHWLFARDGFVRAAGVRADVRFALMPGEPFGTDGMSGRSTVLGSLFLVF